jgi:hypothetical protein
METEMRVGLIFFSMMILTMSLFAEDKHVNFSGEWLHNAEKSDYSEWATTKKLTVIQNDKEIKIIRDVTSEMGDYTDEETISLDGKKCDSENERVRRSSTARWADDGKILHITSDVYVIAFDLEVTAEAKMKLAEGDKVLLVDYSFDTPQGIMELKLQFDRKKKE